LCDPENDSRQHQQDVLRHIRVSEVHELFFIVLQDIFEHQDALCQINAQSVNASPLAQAKTNSRRCRQDRQPLKRIR
jgi:hypothetical protein